MNRKKIVIHVDEVGTYCLIDMEKWIDNIQNMPANGYYNDSNEPANIVFCLDTRNILDNETFENTKNDIKAITEFAFERYSDIKVYVYYQQFGNDFRVKNNLLKDESGKDHFTSCKEALKAVDTLNTFPVVSNFWTYDFVKTSVQFYSAPFTDSQCYGTISINDNVKISGIVFSNDEYWYKVKNEKYNLIGYIKFSSIDTPEKIKDEWYDILLLSPITIPDQCHGICTNRNIHIKDNPNNVLKNAQQTIYLEEYQLSAIKNACTKIKAVYASSNKNNDSKYLVEHYLTPELIIAVSGTESNFFDTTDGGGVGLTPDGVRYIKSMPGGENLSTYISDYKNNFSVNIYAGTVILAYNLDFVLEHYKNTLKNNYNADGTLNEGQAIYNALYIYGAGTDINGYWGNERYSPAESPISSAYKMYIYYTICSKTKIICAVPPTNDIGITLSNYTDLGGGNVWIFEFAPSF